jgi:hypothetical protein
MMKTYVFFAICCLLSLYFLLPKKRGDILHAAALIEAFNGVLAEEIAYLRNEGGRPLVVLDGVLVYRGEEGFLYAFDLEVEAFLFDGTPVRLRCGFRETTGEVVAVRGSELTLALRENLGELLGAGRSVLRALVLAGRPAGTVGRNTGKESANGPGRAGKGAGAPA